MFPFHPTQKFIHSPINFTLFLTMVKYTVDDSPTDSTVQIPIGTLSSQVITIYQRTIGTAQLSICIISLGLE